MTPSELKVTAMPAPYALSLTASSKLPVPCSIVELCSILSSQANGQLRRSSSIRSRIVTHHACAAPALPRVKDRARAKSGQPIGLPEPSAAQSSNVKNALAKTWGVREDGYETALT